MKVQRPLTILALAAIVALPVFPAAADISFSDATADSGIQHTPTESYGASWGDLDGDGRPDLFVSNHRTKPSLYLNIGNGHFIDVGGQTFTWNNKPNADTHGAAWFDFDNNGTQDLYVTTGIGNPDQFLVNERGDLVNRTNTAGLANSTWGGRLPIWADYDGDGLPDFVMMSIEQSAILMRQIKGKKFQNASNVGLACQHQQYAHLLDVMGVGSLDFLCPNGPTFPQKVYNTQPVPWDASPSTRFPAETPGGPDSVVADFNNDGRMDVFLLSGVELRPSGAQLNGDGTVIEAHLMGDGKEFSFKATGPLTMKLTSNVFEERESQILAGSAQPGFETQWILIGQNGSHPDSSTVTCVKDRSNCTVTLVLDPNDPAVANLPTANLDPPTLHIGYVAAEGRWRVVIHSRQENGESAYSDVYFLISSGQPMSDLQTAGLWASDLPAKPVLLMNRAEGFVDETSGSGLDQPISCVSATAGDFDNDGLVDLYMACRTATGNIANILFRNQGNGKFVQVADAGGAAGPIGLAISDGAGTADSAVTADYDGDGFLDVYVTNGSNLFPKAVGGPNKLYRNQTNNGNHWIELDLVGVNSIREATGAVVTATTANGLQTRVKDGGYHRWSQDSSRIHFGLAQAETVDLQVTWPSGTVDRFIAVPVDKVYRATEKAGLAIVNPDIALPYPCGLPSEFTNLSGDALNTALGQGLFIAKDCSSGAWQVRGTRGTGDAPTYTGQLISSSPFERIRTRNFQTADKILCDGAACAPADSSDPTIITAPVTKLGFELHLFGGFRGIDVTPVDGANTCITVDAPEGTPIFYGPLKKPVSSQFYLESLEPCPGGVPVAPPPPEDDGSGDNGGGDNNGGGNGNDPPPGSTSGGSGGGSVDLAFLVGLLAFRVWHRMVRINGAR